MAPIPESMYGEAKRLRFMASHIRRSAAERRLKVLEIGCGTGQGLLIPLSVELRDIADFTGLDSDAGSISAGQEAIRAEPVTAPIRLMTADAVSLPSEISSAPWDAVILSEVLEHVENPASLVTAASRLLRTGGLLLCTVPNGYGPFEIERFLWDGLGVERPFQAVRRLMGRRPSFSPNTRADTNRHICFFRWTDLTAMLESAGFEIGDVRNREFFCGPFSDLAHSALKRVGLGKALISLTQGAAPLVPRSWAADWMVSAVKRKEPGPGGPPAFDGRRSWWWRVKRRQSGRDDLNRPSA